MEPTANDVAAVQSTLPTQPVTPQPSPAETPLPSQPAPQTEPAKQPTPAPSEPSDPFATLFTDPAQTPAPTPTQTDQPVEPSQTPQPPLTPTEPTVQPAAQVPNQQLGESYKSYQEYMDSVLAGVPKTPEAPDPEKINADNPEEIKDFFNNLMTTAEKRFEAKFERKNAIQNAEKKAWDEAFTAYPSLRSNKNVRDMVHNIRMGYFQRNIAITPAQAAKKLVDSLSSSYKQGIADNQVVTTIESVQPQGGTSTPITTSLDKETVMQSVQTGGEQALMDILDAEVKAGRL